MIESGEGAAREEHARGVEDDWFTQRHLFAGAGEHAMHEAILVRVPHHAYAQRPGRTIVPARSVHRPLALFPSHAAAARFADQAQRDIERRGPEHEPRCPVSAAIRVYWLRTLQQLCDLPVDRVGGGLPRFGSEAKLLWGEPLAVAVLLVGRQLHHEAGGVDAGFQVYDVEEATVGGPGRGILADLVGRVVDHRVPRPVEQQLPLRRRGRLGTLLFRCPALRSPGHDSPGGRRIDLVGFDLLIIIEIIQIDELVVVDARLIVREGDEDEVAAEDAHQRVQRAVAFGVLQGGPDMLAHAILSGVRTAAARCEQAGLGADLHHVADGASDDRQQRDRARLRDAHASGGEVLLAAGADHGGEGVRDSRRDHNAECSRQRKWLQ